MGPGQGGQRDDLPQVRRSPWRGTTSRWPEPAPPRHLLLQAGALRDPRGDVPVRGPRVHVLRHLPDLRAPAHLRLQEELGLKRKAAKLLRHEGRATPVVGAQPLAGPGPRRVSRATQPLAGS